MVALAVRIPAECEHIATYLPETDAWRCVMCDELVDADGRPDPLPDVDAIAKDRRVERELEREGWLR
jgi:hypothetical protein